MTERKRVILVDDSPDEVEFILRTLTSRYPGAEVTVFRDGEAAIRHFRDERNGDNGVAHLVLLDLKLPRVSGHDILEAVRSRFTSGRLPVVAFTTSREPSDVSRAYALGANSYVVKPVAFETYLDVVEMTVRYWLDLNVRSDERPGGAGA